MRCTSFASLLFSAIRLEHQLILNLDGTTQKLAPLLHGTGYQPAFGILRESLSKGFRGDPMLGMHVGTSCVAPRPVLALEPLRFLSGIAPSRPSRLCEKKHGSLKLVIGQHGKYLQRGEASASAKLVHLI